MPLDDKVDIQDGESVVLNSTPAIPIFRAGTWKGSTYHEDDLDAIVANFKHFEEQLSPPLVLGHDESEKVRKAAGLPRLGSIKDVFRKGKVLFASFKEVPKALIDLIKQGRYKGLSASFYSDGYPDHEESKGRGPILRHVGILGEEIQHLKVLGSQPLAALAKAFDEMFKEEGLVTVVFSENDIQSFQDESAISESKDGVLFVVGQLKGEEETTVQSILFDRERFTRESALAWLEKHGYSSEKVDAPPEGTVTRFRQRDPDEFEPDSFRVIEPGAEMEEAKGEDMDTGTVPESEDDNALGVSGEETEMSKDAEKAKTVDAAQEIEGSKAEEVEVVASDNAVGFEEAHKELKSEISLYSEQLDAMKKENEELRKIALEERATRIKGEIASFVEGKKTEGRITPAEEDEAKSFLEVLALDEKYQGVHEFGEGKSLSAYDMLRKVYENRPEVNLTEEVVTKDAPSLKSYQEGVRPGSGELAELADEYYKKAKEEGRPVEFSEAVKVVARENRHLA